MIGGPFLESISTTGSEVREHRGTVTVEHKDDKQLRLEQQSHDAELYRIAKELGLEKGATVEDIVEAIRKRYEGLP